MAPLSPTSVFSSSNGLNIPVCGLGTWQSTGTNMEGALEAALEAGYRLIDTAYLYKNEEVIGDVLTRWFASGKLKREDIFITTKLPPQGNNAKYVKEHLEKSLKALKLDYVDLYLIHTPVGFLPGEVKRNSDGSMKDIELDMETDLVAIWKEMEKQVDSGLTKAIGISNFNISQMERIIQNARIMPANLQLELYLYLQCKDIQKFCKSKGITLTSYSSLGSPGAPKSIVTGETANPMLDPVVVRIAEAHGKTPAQVLLRHLLQLGIAIIPKSSSPERIQQNIQIFDFDLSKLEMDKLNSLDKGEEGRRFRFDSLKAHPEHPFRK